MCGSKPRAVCIRQNGAGMVAVPPAPRHLVAARRGGLSIDKHDGEVIAFILKVIGIVLSSDTREKSRRRHGAGDMVRGTDLA